MANPVALPERKHIKGWRDARGETPGMANMIVRIVRALLSYAVDNDYRPDNPAKRIKPFKLGEHRTRSALHTPRDGRAAPCSVVPTCSRATLADDASIERA